MLRSIEIENEFFSGAKLAVSAISLDAPKMKLIEKGRNWMVLTEMADPWLNFGYVVDKQGLDGMNGELWNRNLSGFVYGKSQIIQLNEELPQYHGFSTMQFRSLDNGDMGNFELPEDVTVVKAANLSQIYDSNFVQHRAFGTSLEDLNHTVNSNVLGNNQVRIYNLIYDGQPSSTVTVVSGQISEMPVVQVWSMATLPELQGKGLGKNLLQKVLIESLRVGFKGAALLATDEGKHLYDRLGFQSISQNPRFQIGKKDD